mmetsp:Transcript_7652/g.23929  ORF Transcript_7652/g.23929 Transcript_7652/m.23929 type:complete len:210 (+) Transcript_7652:76-705(+)
MAPAFSSIGCNLPCFCSVMMPGPSLQPPTPSPPMKMLGMLVRRVRSASSARICIPSASISSSSRARNLAPMSFSSFFALMQKGHLEKENITTGFSLMYASTWAFTLASSYSPACCLANQIFPSFNGELDRKLAKAPMAWPRGESMKASRSSSLLPPSFSARSAVLPGAKDRSAGARPEVEILDCDGAAQARRPQAAPRAPVRPRRSTRR